MRQARTRTRYIIFSPTKIYGEPRLDDTIRAHVIADVPVGAFLSGGLDSTAIAALMIGAMGKSLRTFSIGFEESQYSELPAAEAAARHIGSVHQSHILTGTTVARDMESLIGAMDQPTGDAINTYYASKVAREGGVTVALSGLGGDELFGGYPSFRTVGQISRWIPTWRAIPHAVRDPILSRLRAGDTRSRKLADILAYATNSQEVASMQRATFAQASRHALLMPDAVRVIASRSPFHPELGTLSAETAGADLFDIVSSWEMRTYMADLLLRDSDVMSMRHSLELRVPFVDRPLVEWLRRQPAEFRFTPGAPKSALAEAVRDVLPPDIFNRAKRGFSLPFGLWMKRDLRPFLDETFSGPSIERSGLFTTTSVQALWRGFLSRDDTREWSRVWSLAVLISFLNRCPRS